MITINKTHSKLDLIQVILDLGLPIVYSHQDNKKDIQIKLQNYIKDIKKYKKKYPNNVYQINNLQDLKFYLISQNPKKNITIKERKIVMYITKQIISYCVNGRELEWNNYYNDTQQIEDDMNYIKQFGDIPSVRRACFLMNKDMKQEFHFHPIISPQVKNRIKIVRDEKQKVFPQLISKHGRFLLDFD